MTTYDVTLKGWSEVFDNPRVRDLPAELCGRADGLVKWVRAPDLEAVRLFLERSGLLDHVGMPPRIISDRPFADGLDVELDLDGAPVLGRPDTKRWRQSSEVVCAVVAAYDEVLANRQRQYRRYEKEKEVPPC